MRNKTLYRKAICHKVKRATVSVAPSDTSGVVVVQRFSKGRIAVRLLLSTLYFAVVLFVGFPSLALAYIDPATTSYLIQIAAALVITLSVALGVFFGKLQMFLLTLRARLSAIMVRARVKRRGGELFSAKTSGEKSTHEKPDTSSEEQNGAAIYAPTSGSQGMVKLAHVVPPRTPAEREQAAQTYRDQQKLQAKKGARGGASPLRSRLAFASLLAAGIVFTCVIFGIFDIFIANSADFPYPIADVLLPVIVLGLVLWAVLTLVLLPLRGKVFDGAAALFLGILLMVYIQGNFLNFDLGELTGDAVDWGKDTTWMIANTLICLALIALPFVLLKLSRKKIVWRGALVFLPALIIVVQALSLVTLFATSGVLSQTKGDIYTLSEKGLYEVSAGKNVIVILLDRCDSRYVDEVMADDPDFFADKMDGFTRFTNSMTLYNRTFPSVVNILTGKELDPSEPPKEYMATAWREETFLSDLTEAGFQNDLYTLRNSAFVSADVFGDTVSNVELHKHETDISSVLPKLMKLSLYRFMPQVFKPRFWVATEELSHGVSYFSPGGREFGDDDPRFWHGLKEQRLKAVGERPRFKFYHLRGAHPAFVWDKDMRVVEPDQSSQLLQTRGAWTITFEYLDQLKQLGLYDNATIVVTADHGFQGRIGDGPLLPALFVKPAGSYGSALVTNDAPVTSASLRATLLADIGLSTAGYGPTFFEVAPDVQITRPFHFWYSPTGTEVSTGDYLVTGDARDFANWHLLRQRTIPYDFL
ncbi:MAG: sulfatase-like hydrolase/transferase [Coriobacteriales bacterium]|jgi:hypothetical protein|nr:sulfatase-like hydrolase/transferase [Coriobacteriales bacterium]